MGFFDIVIGGALGATVGAAIAEERRLDAEQRHVEYLISIETDAQRRRRLAYHARIKQQELDAARRATKRERALYRAMVIDVKRQHFARFWFLTIGPNLAVGLLLLTAFATRGFGAFDVNSFGNATSGLSPTSAGIVGLGNLVILGVAVISCIKPIRLINARFSKIAKE